ncbi:MAG TPA: AAA family ATPase [Rectinemataceae bacterium]|nr:AAA family ATPase [Rectinemataceae bacterium]
MRPIELVVECFGAYRDRAVVDFSRLGPLFLVWGKTGSGKSTLFDAISYALYGEASGGRRGLSRELRSHYAAEGRQPIVEFTFALGQRSWRARRSPPWSRPGRRGTAVEVPQSAVLEALVGDVWKVEAEGPRDVDARTRELLGLSVDEFSKIILLPQGEFQRFLEMGTTERVEILEKLFPVGLHDRVTRIAADRSKEAAAEARRLDVEIERLGREGGGVEGEAKLLALGEEAAGLELEVGAALRARIEAEKAFERGREDVARREDHGRALARLEGAERAAAREGGLGDQIAGARRAAAVLPRLDEAARSLREALKAREALAARAAELGEAEARRGGIEEDRSRIGVFEADLADIQRRAGELGPAIEAWKSLDAARAKTAALDRRIKGGSSKLAEARSREAEARLSYEEARIGVEELEGARASFEAAREALERVKAQLRGDELLSKAEVGLSEARLAADGAAQRLAACEASLYSLLEARDRSLACELAERLEEGRPCPVCGSTAHPAPASATGGAAVGDIDEAKGARDRALSARAGAEALLRQREEALGEARASLLSLAGDGLVDGTVDLASLRGSLAESSARAAREAAEKAAAYRAAMEKKAAEEGLAASLEDSRSRLKALEAAEAADRSALAAAKAQLLAFEASAGEEDPRPRLLALEEGRRAIEVALKEARSRVSDWERVFESLKARHAETASRQPGLEAASAEAASLAAEALAAASFGDEGEARAAALPPLELSALEAELQGIRIELAAAKAAADAASRSIGSGPPPDLEALEGAAAAALARHGELAAGLESLRSARDALEALLGRRRELEEARRSLDEKEGRLAFLAELLGGKLAPRKLPFKNWVLAAWFRTVVDRASLRLAELSDGRYTLAADEGQGMTQGRLGLEILVRDAWTGRSRPAGTLSGGERFLSSLSLALGLADTIKSRSGGVSLDAVFVDEGFGSLDDEALDRAIGALDRIRGNRTIGIVSHVAELRNRIPSRIEVIKGRSGSSLALVGESSS